MDTSIILLLVGINAVLGGVVAYAAKSKGRSAAGFFLLSIFFSFLVAVLVLIAIPPLNDSLKHGHVACPFCDETISPRATICPHCRSGVSEKLAEIESERLLALETIRLETQKTLEIRELENLARADARNEFLRRVLNSKLLRIGTVLIVFLAVWAAASNVLRTDALNKLSCTVDLNSVSLKFEIDVELKFKLNEECKSKNQTAMSNGTTTYEELSPHVKLTVLFDNSLVYENVIPQDFTSDLESSVSLSRFLFHQYSEKTTQIAKNLTLKFKFGNSFSESEIQQHRSLIPTGSPMLKKLVSTCFGKKGEYCGTLFAFETYQVAEDVLFDFPGTENDVHYSAEDITDGRLSAMFFPLVAEQANVKLSIDGQEIRSYSVKLTNP